LGIQTRHAYVINGEIDRCGTLLLQFCNGIGDAPTSESVDVCSATTDVVYSVLGVTSKRQEKQMAFNWGA